MTLCCTELNPASAEALMERTNYLALRCLAKATLGSKPTVEEWAKLFDDLESRYKSLLTEAGFELTECHEICHRKDTHDQEEPEEEEIDERVPHLLNALGKGLAAFVRAFPDSEREAGQGKKKRKKAAGPRFTRAVEVLRSAHHFHDKLGGYYLACLYASPAFEDEEVSSHRVCVAGARFTDLLIQVVALSAAMPDLARDSGQLRSA
jgi:hypothetical protein